ncbi:MAG: hypothetical protein ACP6IY_18505 [Promethearchaeia archaeon]
MKRQKIAYIILLSLLCPFFVIYSYISVPEGSIMRYNQEYQNGASIPPLEYLPLEGQQNIAFKGSPVIVSYIPYFKYSGHMYIKRTWDEHDASSLCKSRAKGNGPNGKDYYYHKELNAYFDDLPSNLNGRIVIDKVIIKQDDNHDSYIVYQFNYKDKRGVDIRAYYRAKGDYKRLKKTDGSDWGYTSWTRESLHWGHLGQQTLYNLEADSNGDIFIRVQIRLWENYGRWDCDDFSSSSFYIKITLKVYYDVYFHIIPANANSYKDNFYWYAPIPGTSYGNYTIAYGTLKQMPVFSTNENYYLTNIGITGGINNWETNNLKLYYRKNSNEPFTKIWESGQNVYFNNLISSEFILEIKLYNPLEVLTLSQTDPTFGGDSYKFIDNGFAYNGLGVNLKNRYFQPGERLLLHATSHLTDPKIGYSNNNEYQFVMSRNNFNYDYNDRLYTNVNISSSSGDKFDSYYSTIKIRRGDFEASAYYEVLSCYETYSEDSDKLGTVGYGFADKPIFIYDYDIITDVSFDSDHIYANVSSKMYPAINYFPVINRTIFCALIKGSDDSNGDSYINYKDTNYTITVNRLLFNNTMLEKVNFPESIFTRQYLLKDDIDPDYNKVKLFFNDTVESSNPIDISLHVYPLYAPQNPDVNFDFFSKSYQGLYTSDKKIEFDFYNHKAPVPDDPSNVLKLPERNLILYANLTIYQPSSGFIKNITLGPFIYIYDPSAEGGIKRDEYFEIVNNASYYITSGSNVNSSNLNQKLNCVFDKPLQNDTDNYYILSIVQDSNLITQKHDKDNLITVHTSSSINITLDCPSLISDDKMKEFSVKINGGSSAIKKLSYKIFNRADENNPIYSGVLADRDEGDSINDNDIYTVNIDPIKFWNDENYVYKVYCERFGNLDYISYKKEFSVEYYLTDIQDWRPPYSNYYSFGDFDKYFNYKSDDVYANSFVQASIPIIYSSTLGYNYEYNMKSFSTLLYKAKPGYKVLRDGNYYQSLFGYESSESVRFTFGPHLPAYSDELNAYSDVLFFNIKTPNVELKSFEEQEVKGGTAINLTMEITSELSFTNIHCSYEGYGLKNGEQYEYKLFIWDSEQSKYVLSDNKVSYSGDYFSGVWTFNLNKINAGQTITVLIYGFKERGAEIDWSPYIYGGFISFIGIFLFYILTINKFKDKKWLKYLIMVGIGAGAFIASLFGFGAFGMLAPYEVYIK